MEGQPRGLPRVPCSPKGRTLLLCSRGSRCYLLADQPLTSGPFEQAWSPWGTPSFCLSFPMGFGFSGQARGFSEDRTAGLVHRGAILPQGRCTRWGSGWVGSVGSWSWQLCLPEALTHRPGALSKSGRPASVFPGAKWVSGHLLPWEGLQGYNYGRV